MSKWTHFHDMHSGGDLKEGNYSHIFIEAPEETAKIIFYNRFGHDPDRVTCTCCGNDYSISEDDSLEQATAYQRNCAYDDSKQWVEKKNKYHQPYISLEDALKLGEFDGDKFLVIYAHEIKPEETQGEIRKSGYVWID